MVLFAHDHAIRFFLYTEYLFLAFDNRLKSLLFAAQPWQLSVTTTSTRVMIIKDGGCSKAIFTHVYLSWC